jgi:hypothetical protein
MQDWAEAVPAEHEPGQVGRQVRVLVHPHSTPCAINELEVVSPAQLGRFAHVPERAASALANSGLRPHIVAMIPPSVDQPDRGTMKLLSALRRPRAFWISTCNIIDLLFSMAGVVLLFRYALPTLRIAAPAEYFAESPRYNRLAR